MEILRRFHALVLINSTAISPLYTQVSVNNVKPWLFDSLKVKLHNVYM